MRKEKYFSLRIFYFYFFIFSKSKIEIRNPKSFYRSNITIPFCSINLPLSCAIRKI